ncbi:hypothetical protein Ancab_026786 [Ancistrocladus abbreviatus]
MDKERREGGEDEMSMIDHVFDSSNCSYCVYGPPRLDDENIVWSCEDCVPFMSNRQHPLRKSERITSIIDRAIQRRKARSRWKKTIMLQVIDKKQKSHDKALLKNYGLVSCTGMKDLQPSASNFDDRQPLLENKSIFNVAQKSNFLGGVTVEEVRPMSSKSHTTCRSSGLDNRTKSFQIIGTHGDQQKEMGEKCSDYKTNDCHYHLHVSMEDECSQSLLTMEGSRGSTKRKKTFVIEEDEEVRSFVEGKTAQPKADGNNRGASTMPISSQPCSEFFIQPIFDTIWRGFCKMKSDKYGSTSFGLEAHLSNRACLRVCQVASAFPTSLNFEILSKDTDWPRRFQKSPPSDEDIALFFLPVYESDERLYDCLLEKMIDCDLVLKFGMNYVKLLVASSLELPEELWRFNRKYYMWGVFVQQTATPKLETNTAE